MVEMVIGLFLVAMIILTAMSFMVFQSRYARSTTQHRGSREGVSLATNMISTDIRQSGYGLYWDSSMTTADIRNLAVYMDSYKTSGSQRWYETLHVSFGMFLTDDPKTPPSVFDTPSQASQTGVAESAYPFSTSLVSAPQVKQRIGSLIGFNSAMGYTGGRYAVNMTFNEGTNKFDLATPSTSTHYYSPAVVYTYSADDYAILRNGERVIGGGLDLRVTGFQVRATFYDTENPVNPVTGTPEWECPTHGKLFSAFKIQYLRSIMVTIKYKLRQEMETSDPELMWTRAPERSTTLVGAPRALIFQASFTDLP